MSPKLRDRYAMSAPHMNSKRADSVLVWLCDALDNPNFSLPRHTRRRRGGNIRTNTILEEGRRDPAHPIIVPHQNPQAYHEIYEVTRRLEGLLQRSWFTRVWVIQEVALAKEITIGCVNAFFSWDDLAEATRSLFRAQGSVSKSLFDAPIKIMDARDQYRATGNVNVELVLGLSRTFECTELRDKVYGMLGLNDELATAIGRPNYEKPLPEVWADMARALLGMMSLRALCLMTAEVDLVTICQETTDAGTDQEPGWLAEMDRIDIRRRLGRLHNMPPLPSWVPNLQNLPLTWPMSTRGVDQVYGNPVIMIDGLSLQVKAAFVDKIGEVSAWSTSGGNAEMHSTWNQWLEEAGSLDPYQRPYRHPEEANFRYLDDQGLSMELIFWRTLFCDVDNVITDTPQLEQWHLWFCLEIAMNLRLFDSRLLLDRDSEVWTSPSGLAMNIAALRNSTRHKALFSTEKILFGLGPRGVKKGDHVVFFSGYNVPFLLRTVEGRGQEYHIIGPVFVHGLMNAERVRWSEFEWQEVVII